MTSEEKAKNWQYIAGHLGAKLQIETISKMLDQHAAESTRETIATWMIKQGYATGHGNTTKDLLEELLEQIKEGKEEQWKICAYAVDNAINKKQLWENDRILAINACINAGRK